MLPEEEIKNQKQFDQVFNNLVKLTLNTIEQNRQGPKPITIEEYQKRTRVQKIVEPKIPKPVKLKRHRGGKQFKIRKLIAKLYERINLSTSKEEIIKLKKEIKELRSSNK